MRGVRGWESCDLIASQRDEARPWETDAERLVRRWGAAGEGYRGGSWGRSRKRLVRRPVGLAGAVVCREERGWTVLQGGAWR